MNSVGSPASAQLRQADTPARAPGPVPGSGAAAARRWLNTATAAFDRAPLLASLTLCLAAAAPHLIRQPISWRFFRTAGALVLHGTLLTAYATHPQLQFGPLAFLAAAPLAALPQPASALVGTAVMVLLGAAALSLLHAAVRGREPAAPAAFWPAAACAAAAWGDLAARYGHLDDALALALIAGGVLATAHRRPMLAAALLALSVDAKPWAVPLVALLLVFPSRSRWPAIALWALVVATAWAPFAVATIGSLNAARFAIPIEPASSLSLLHLAAQSTPWWCRPAQMAIGTGLAALAARRRSVPAALVAVFAVRLGLDPSVKAYYDVELLLATLLCDSALAFQRVPWLTMIAAATVYAPTYMLTGFPAAHAVIRTAGLAAVTAAALWLAARQPRERRSECAGPTLGSRCLGGLWEERR